MNICPCCKTSHDSTACPTPSAKGLDEMSCSPSELHRMGYVLAAAVLQSDLCCDLDDEERAALDYFIEANAKDLPPANQTENKS